MFCSLHFSCSYTMAKCGTSACGETLWDPGTSFSALSWWDGWRWFSLRSSLQCFRGLYNNCYQRMACPISSCKHALWMCAWSLPDDLVQVPYASILVDVSRQPITLHSTLDSLHSLTHTLAVSRLQTRLVNILLFRSVCDVTSAESWECCPWILKCFPTSRGASPMSFAIV